MVERKKTGGSLDCGALLVGMLVLCGCDERPAKPVEVRPTLDVTNPPQPVEPNRDVDILFVIDNSGSMADEQRTLSRSFERFITKLESPEVRANYHIAVTTTDSGNPACTGNNDTDPEMGKLQMSSCRDRLDEFIFRPGDEETDERQTCLDVCPRLGFEVLPTTGPDGEVASRRWLESIDGVRNLPADWTTSEAFGCFGPQGVAGCGFESPLESMHRALRLAKDPHSHAYGFLRPYAALAVIIVTDEYDCSHNPDHEDVFVDDDSEFWPAAATGATSAICWHAGVACAGGPESFDDCHAVNLDAAGSLVDTDPEDDAVLRPVSRYISFIEDIEREMQVYSPSRRVVVSVLGGVPIGYARGAQKLEYVAAASPDRVRDFGVEPGCVFGEQEAYPPVRLREWAEAFEIDGQRNLFSICSDGYDEALETIADRIVDQI